MASAGDAGRRVGVVVIGRDEGERLVAALRAVRGCGAPVVYVDSGSRDGSPARATALADAVVELDPSRPFTAARGRNEGHAFLRARHPSLEWVQFVDGDTVLAPGWLEAGAEALARDPSIAAVAGRLDEADGGRYARLLRMEWAAAPGDTTSCGGIAMFRAQSFEQAGGFADDLPAGEEPELCARLRRAGHRIVRIDRPMGLHHGDIERFGTWWWRAVRAGEAAFECAWRGGRRWAAEDVRRVTSALLWGGAAPLALALAVAGLGVAGMPAAALAAVVAGLALYALQAWRIARARRAHGESDADARLFATWCLFAKPAECAGVTRALGRRILGRNRAAAARDRKAPAAGPV